MTQNTDVFSLKRIKYLFGIFVKQFTVDEYKLLMQFLQLSINRFNANNECLSLDSPQITSKTANTTASNKRKPTNSVTNPKQNSKIAKIEQTINMLKKNRNEEMTCEEFSDILLDDEELNLIEEDNLETKTSAKTNQFNEIEDYDDSEYISYDSCCPNGDFNPEYEEEFNDFYEEDDGNLNSQSHDELASSVGHLTPGSDYNSQKGMILDGLVTNSKVKSEMNNSPRKFIRKFNDEIRHELEMKFLENNFISGIEKDRLAVRLNLTERQVKKWFEKRREKKRRMEKVGLSGSGKGVRNKAVIAPTVNSHVKQVQALMSQLSESVTANAYLDMLVSGKQLYERRSKLNGEGF